MGHVSEQMIQLLLYSLIHVLLYMCEAEVYRRWVHWVQAGGSSSEDIFTEAAVHGACPFGRGAGWRRNQRTGGSMEFKVGTLFLKKKTPIPIGHSTSATVNSPSIILSRQWRDSGARMKQSLGRQKLVRPRDSSLTVTNTVVK
jgi:hypothetical protein